MALRIVMAEHGGTIYLKEILMSQLLDLESSTLSTVTEKQHTNRAVFHSWHRSRGTIIIMRMSLVDIQGHVL